jgi:GTP cyclohydrolase II
MKRLSPHAPEPNSPSSAPFNEASGQEAPAGIRLRQIHQASQVLRAGGVVLLRGQEPILLLGAETALASSVAELVKRAAAPPVLMLTKTKVADIFGPLETTQTEVVAFALPKELLSAEALRGVAESSVPQAETGSLRLKLSAWQPRAGAAALKLMKHAGLLPAFVVAKAPAEFKDLSLSDIPASPSENDLSAYSNLLAQALRPIAEAVVPLAEAPEARVIAFRVEGLGTEEFAIVIGELAHHPAPLVRLHSACFTGDLLGSLRCDCGQQLRGAIRRMAEEGAGVLLYLAQEGRGIGLVNKLRAYALQDQGLDTLDANRALGWEADERNFQIAARMLELLGVKRVRLLTNNPRKVAALSADGIEVIAREPLVIAPNGVNDRYLATKAKRFGHLLG